MTVNKKQSVVLWVALVSGVVMGTLPPWIYTTDYTSAMVSERSERPAGYAFIGSQPVTQPNHHFSKQLSGAGTGVRIDATRLAVQYIVLAIIGGGLLFILKGKASAGLLSQSRTYTDEELNAAIRKTKSASKPKPPDNAGDDSDDDDNPPSSLPVPASIVQREGSRGVVGTANARSRWRLYSMASVGFRFDPWLWILSFAGGLFPIFIDGIDRVALDNGSSMAWTFGGVMGSALTCFVFALASSYVAWRVAPKASNAPFWGGLCGIALAVAIMMFDGTFSNKDRQRHESAARWNAEYLAR
jgi:hypothetical protein